MDFSIVVTKTVRFKGGMKIERGSVLPARKSSPELGGYSVAHPRVEGCYAHVPATHAKVAA